MASDQELLTSFVDRLDHRAFAQIVSRYGPMVLRTARRILIDEHDAEDVFQAVFLCACQASRYDSSKEGTR